MCTSGFHGSFLHVARSLKELFQSVHREKEKWFVTGLCFCVSGVLVGASLFQRSQASRGPMIREAPGEMPQELNAELPVETAPEVSASRGSGIIHGASNAPEVDPMIADVSAPFYPSRISTEGKQLKSEMFLKAESCSECHTEIYN